ncbi:phycobilisome rod-core linker polypeptide [Synechocystis sp. B12]|nr:phycobilisome rod-core linker polypeptide [Synechocystis sp. B12]
MTLPLIAYAPVSQNQRVTNYEVSGDEHARIFTTEGTLSPSAMDNLIAAAYRQVFNEQQMIQSNRQIALESQFKNQQITVRDFIRGLALSDSFRRRNFEVNNNYRFAQMCIQRLLGRDVYSEEEKIAWSIVIATKGLPGFINELLNSQEYLENFGYDTVPYQRRRILPQRISGELPFARMPRYGADHREKLEAIGYFRNQAPLTYRWEWQKQPYPAGVYLAGKVVLYVGGALVSLGIIAVALSAWGIIEL